MTRPTVSVSGKTVLIMAAGTGGHVMPGLAIAQAMQARGWTVRWLGTRHGIENRLVPPTGIAMDTVEFAGMRGKGLMHTLRGAFNLTRAFLACLVLVGRIRPNVVLGMGGYVTVPGGIGAWLHRRPLVLMNSDAALLLSNRFLARFSRRVLFGLPADTASLGDKAQWTGCPVRAEIGQVTPPAQRYAGRSGPLRILVVGGSLGAMVLNRTVPAALALLPPFKQPKAVHQSGAQHLDALKAEYAAAGIEAETVAFVEDMGRRYEECDLVICRAGAITVSELAVAGVPSILIPLTVSTTSHQRDNAVYMEKAGAAVHLPQTEFTPQKLAEVLASLTRERLRAMAEAAKKIGQPDATETVAKVLEEVAKA